MLGDLVLEKLRQIFEGPQLQVMDHHLKQKVNPFNMNYN